MKKPKLEQALNLELRVSGTQYRRFDVGDAPVVDLETRRMKTRMSSEFPFLKSFAGKMIYEVLGHAPGEVDLSLATGARRLPFIDNHDVKTTLGSYPSVVHDEVNAALDGVVEFSTSPAGENAMHDYAGRHRRDVSVGYDLLKIISVKQERGKKHPTVRFAWRPRECSSVHEGADPCAGAIRKKTEETYILKYREEESMKDKKGNLPGEAKDQKPGLEENATGSRAAKAGVTPPGYTLVSNETLRAAEQLRCDNVRSIAKQAIEVNGLDRRQVDTMANDLIYGKRSGGANEMLVWVAEETSKLTDGQRAAGDVELSKKEIKEYSFSDGIRSLCKGTFHTRNSFEKEVSEACFEQGKNLGIGVDAGDRESFMIPTVMMNAAHTRSFTDADINLMNNKELLTALGINVRAAGVMDPAVANQGGNWLANNAVPGMMYQALVDATWFDKVGIRKINMSNTFTIPGISGLMTPAARSDKEDAALSHFTTQTRTMSPNIVSVQMNLTGLMQIEGAKYGIEALASSLIGESMGLKLGQQATDGTGENGEIRGIKNIAGAGLVALGTNGAAPDWDMLVDLETQVNNANIRTGTTSYVFNTQSVGKMKKTVRVSGQDRMLIEPPAFAGVDLAVNGHKLVQSNQLSSNLTKGSGTGLSHGAFLVGPHLYWASFGATRIIRDNITGAVSDLLKIIAHGYNDFMAVYSGAVVNVIDIDNS